MSKDNKICPYILDQSYQIAYDTLPEVIIICTDGEIKTKLLGFYKQYDGFVILFDDKFIDDSPKKLDVSDLIIHKTHMKDILKYLEIRNIKQAFGGIPENGKVTTIHCDSLLLALKFFDKYLLDEPHSEIMKYIHSITYAPGVLTLVYSSNIRNVDIGSEYTRMILLIRKNLDLWKEFLKQKMEELNRPDLDAIIYKQICIM